MTPAELRAARHKLGLTQKGLARALRMATRGCETISRWENGTNERGVPGPVQVAIEMMLLISNNRTTP
jgi:transcriptional regulator with XRE-family HTH domain